MLGKFPIIKIIPAEEVSRAEAETESQKMEIPVCMTL